MGFVSGYFLIAAIFFALVLTEKGKRTSTTFVASLFWPIVVGPLLRALSAEKAAIRAARQSKETSL